MTIDEIIKRQKEHLTKAQINELIQATERYKQLNAANRAQATGTLTNQYRATRRGLQNTGLAGRKGKLISGQEKAARIRANEAYRSYNAGLRQIDNAYAQNRAARMANETARENQLAEIEKIQAENDKEAERINAEYEAWLRKKKAAEDEYKRQQKEIERLRAQQQAQQQQIRERIEEDRTEQSGVVQGNRIQRLAKDKHPQLETSDYARAAQEQAVQRAVNGYKQTQKVFRQQREADAMYDAMHPGSAITRAPHTDDYVMEQKRVENARQLKVSGASDAEVWFADAYGVSPNRYKTVKNENPELIKELTGAVQDLRTKNYDTVINTQGNIYDKHQAREDKAKAESAISKAAVAMGIDDAETRKLYLMDDTQFAVAFAAAAALAAARQKYDSSDAIQDQMMMSGKSGAFNNATRDAEARLAKFDQVRRLRYDTADKTLYYDTYPTDVQTKDAKTVRSFCAINQNTTPYAWANPKNENGENWYQAAQNGWKAENDGNTKYGALVNDWSLVGGRQGMRYQQTGKVAALLANVMPHFYDLADETGTYSNAFEDTHVQSWAVHNGISTADYYDYVRNSCVKAFYGNNASHEDYEQMDAMLALANLMTDEERARFNELANGSYGAFANEADEYFEYLYKNVLPERFKAYVDELNGVFTDTTYGKIGQSTLSVLTNLGEGITGPIHTLTTNYNDSVSAQLGAMKYTTAQAARESVSKDFSPVGKFFYDEGMSIADSGTVALISGGIGKALQGAGVASNIASKAGSVLGGSILGGSAFNSAYKEALDRGLSPDKARLTAVGQGINEMLFESLSIELLFDHFKKGGMLKFFKNRWANLGVNVAASTVSEGSEEVVTEAFNTLWDKQVNSIYSKMDVQLRKYVAEGDSFEVAWKKVQDEYAEELGMAFAGGALSGGVMGGGASFLGMVQNRGNEKVGKGLRQNSRVMNELRNFDFKSEYAQEILTQDKLTNQDVADLFNIRQQELLGQYESDIQQAVADGKITQEQADLLKKYEQNGVQIVHDGEVVANENGITVEQMPSVQDAIANLDNAARIQFLNNEEMRSLVQAVGGETAAVIEQSETAEREAEKAYRQTIAEINSDTTLTDEQKAERKEEAKRTRQNARSEAEKIADAALTNKKGIGAKLETDGNGTVKVGKGSGKVTYDFSTKDNPGHQTVDSMTATEQSALRIAKVVAASRPDVNVKVEAEFVGEHANENGYYDRSTNTIHINMSGDNSVLWTLSHELTHHLANTDTEAYTALRTAIETALKDSKLTTTELEDRGFEYDLDRVDPYIAREGNLWDALVAFEREEHGYGKDAEEEVVARCCESFLGFDQFVKDFARKQYKSARAVNKFIAQMNIDMQRVSEDARQSAAQRNVWNDESPENQILRQLTEIDRIANLWRIAVNAEAKKRQAAREETRASTKDSVKRSDAEYLDLARRYESGDKSVEAELRKAVDAAAKEAGYNEVWSHGSPNASFHVFDLSKAKNAKAIFLSDAGVASEYAGTSYKGVNTRMIGKSVTTVEDALYEFKRIEDGFHQPYRTELGWSIPRSKDLNLLKTKGLSDEELIDAANKLRGKRTGGVYNLFVKTGNKLTVDANDKWWNRINSEYGKTTDDIGKWALQNGYDSVEIDNVHDGGFNDAIAQDILLVFDNRYVKSADLVTYDKDNNIIPLSERFKTDRTGEDAWKNEDIRYSLKDSVKPRSAQEQRDKGYKLSKSKFDSLYSAHKIDIGKRWGSIDAQINDILKNGFKGGSGAINVLPVSTYEINTWKGVRNYKDLLQMEKEGKLDNGYADRYRKELGDEYGKPVFNNVVQAEFALKKGETVLLVPKSEVQRDKVKQGFKPLPYEIVTAERDYQPLYELYEKSYDEYVSSTNEKNENTRYSLKEGEERAIKIADGKTKDGETVSFIDLLLDGEKTGETRTTRASIKPNAWVGIYKDGKVYGRVKFGDPMWITKQSEEYKTSYIKDTNYDIDDSVGGKWYYPVLEVQDFRDNPIPTNRAGQWGAAYNLPKNEDIRYSLKDDVKQTDITEYEHFNEEKYANMSETERIEYREHIAEMQIRKKARERQRAIDRNRRIRRDLTAMLKRGNDRIVKLLANPTENSHVPVQLAQAVSEYAIALNELVTKSQPKTGENAGREKQTKKGRFNADKLIRAYEQSFADEETIAAARAENPNYDPRGLIDPAQYDETLVKMMRVMGDIIENKHMNDLTNDELQLVLNTMRGVIHTVQDANKMIGQGERRAIWEVGDRMVTELEEAPSVSARKYLNASLDLRRLALIYNGSNENAEMVKLVGMLNDGDIEKERVAQQLSGMFSELTAEHAKEMRKWYGKNAEWIDTGIVKHGKKVEITKGMRISLAMHVLNEGNMNHITNGGITIPDRELYNKGKLNDAYANGTLVRLDKEQIHAIISQMTETEKAYLEIAKEFFHKRTGYYVNKTSLQLLGYRKATVENYFPIHTDRNYTRSDFAAVMRDGSIEGQGFLRERVMATNPVYLEDITSVVNRQIKGVSLYAGLAVPMRNFNAVMNASIYEDENGRWLPRTTVRKTMTQKMGDYGAKVVQEFLQDVSGMSAVDVKPSERIVAKLQTRYVKAVLLANLKVTLKQAASYPTAAAVIPWKYLMKALRKGGKNHRLISRADVDLINQYTPLYQMRRDGMANEITSIMAERGLEQKMPWLLGWITKMDVATVGRLWSACEYMVADQQNNLPVGSDEYYKAVAKVFNKTIQETQPNFTPLQRNAALRSKNPIVRTLVLFGTQRMQNGGILIENAMALKQAQTPEARKAARVKLGRAVASQIIQNALLILMGFAVDAVRGRMKGWNDEDKELTKDSVLMNVGDQFMSNILGSFLGGSEIWDIGSGLVKKSLGKSAYDTEFTIPALDALETIISFGKDEIPSFIRYMAGDASAYEKQHKAQAFTKKLAKAAGYVTGFPFENMTKDLFDGINPLIQDIVHGVDAGEFIPWLHNSGRLDKEKTNTLYKEWTRNGFKGSEFFYWTDKLQGVSGGREGRIPVLMESDLTNEQKALLMRMMDTSGGYEQGTAFYNKKGELIVDFANPTEKQALPMPDAEPSEEPSAEPVAEATPQPTENPLSEAKQEGVRQAVAKGVDEQTANDAFLAYQNMGKNHGDDYSRNDDFRAWLFKNVQKPEERAILEYQVIGQASKVEGAVTYRDSGVVYRDYTNESWFKLSEHNLSKDGTNKRYEAGKRLEKTGLSVDKTVAIYDGLKELTKKAEWTDYLKKQGLTEEQINIFLWSRGWAK